MRGEQVMLYLFAGCVVTVGFGFFTEFWFGYVGRKCRFFDCNAHDGSRPNLL